MKNKRPLIIICVIISLLVTGVCAQEINNRYKAPSEKLSLAYSNFEYVVNKISAECTSTLNLNVSKSDFNLNDTQYKLHYLTEENLTSEGPLHKNLSDSDEWLFIINYKGKSASYILIGETMSKSNELLMFGGNAQMFDNALNFANKSWFNEVKLLMYSGQYYFVNSKNEVIQVPKSEEEYLSFKDYYEVPMDGEKVCQIMKDRYEAYLSSKDIEYGVKSLLEIYFEL